MSQQPHLGRVDAEQARVNGAGTMTSHFHLWSPKGRMLHPIFLVLWNAPATASRLVLCPDCLEPALDSSIRHLKEGEAKRQRAGNGH